MERLIIRNFGGIKSLEIELNKINILIGPQASGKSITAKLFYFFKNFTDSIWKAIIDDKTEKSEIDKQHLNIFMTFFPPQTWSKENFLIEYEFNNTFIKIYRNGNKNIKLEYSKDIRKIICLASDFWQKNEKYNIEQEDDIRLSLAILLNDFSKEFKNIVKNVIPDIFSYQQIFIPAGRSFFSNIQSNIFSLLSMNQSLDPFLMLFGSIYKQSKGFFSDLLNDNLFETNDKDFDNLIHNILNSEYIRDSNNDYLMHNDGRKVDLSYASSGQQEILPLLLILKNLLVKYSVYDGVVLYIEEPEAHLFPNAQKMIVELLARIYNARRNKIQIIITTHSPYILSSFNNLMYAGNLASSINKEKIESIYSIIPKEEIIFPKNVSAFSIKPSKDKHLLKDLIDKDTKLISQNYLDDVSNNIAIDFGKLLDLESDL